MRYGLRMAALATTLVCGCGATTDMPEVAPVTGTVTLDGQPVAMARVSFSPVDGGQTSEATTDAAGHYELNYKRDIMGAKIGRHRVVITTYVAPETTDEGELIGGMPERIPVKYNTHTTLEEEVAAGENRIDFALTSS